MQLSKQSLDWALQHATSEGDTDLFPQPFEYKAISADWDTIGPYLASQDVDQWQTRPLRRCLTPNGRYGFRVATQLDPLDFLLFSALVYEAGSDFEAYRAPDHIAMSYRFDPDSSGQLFSWHRGFPQFQAESFNLANEAAYVTTTDIADFSPASTCIA